MIDPELEALEIELFLEALRRRYGYDYREYAPASLRRRTRALRVSLDAPSIAALIPRVIHEPALLDSVVHGLSVPTSELFRDPEVYRTLRTEVLPVLRTWPQPHVWIAGCATGEEIYSLAIMLHEEDLLDHCQLYATDVDAISLARAEEGIFPARGLPEAAEAYRRAGGRGSLHDYCHVRYNYVKFDSFLRRGVLFSQHNLSADGVFCEMHLICCRNVLIYFKRSLQNRVLRLLCDSLARGGYLVLGLKEDVHSTEVEGRFSPVASEQAIFRRTAEA